MEILILLWKFQVTLDDRYLYGRVMDGTQVEGGSLRYLYIRVVHARDEVAESIG